MATIPSPYAVSTNGYPTTDGKPMAETDRHRDLMLELIEALREYFTARRRVYVSGNLLMFYERGNRRRHVSPDVFVVRGVEKRERLNYLVWEEGRAPQLVIEPTSSSTRHEDLRTKFTLYRDTLKVREYFLFDPHGDYLDPVLQGYRLRGGEYRAIRAVEGRLPSQVLGLHLEPRGQALRLFDPGTGRLLPDFAEVRRRAGRAEQAEAENERLRRELEELRSRRP